MCTVAKQVGILEGQLSVLETHKTKINKLTTAMKKEYNDKGNTMTGEASADANLLAGSDGGEHRLQWSSEGHSDILSRRDPQYA